ncbi:MAG: helix-turn-helix domain-containing protein [Haloquadratum sp.]
MDGIRAELVVDSPSDCPAAQASAATGTTASSIRKSVPNDPRESVTEEFVLDSAASADPDDFDRIEGAVDLDGDLRAVFAYDSERVYRFERAQDRACLCARVESFDCPILDVHARDGTLHLTFHAPDIDTLRSIVARLGEENDVSVHRLLRSGDGREDADLVLVDRSRLTDRQREVLTTAHEMGYFQYPKCANAEEVAAELGIDPSTFTEHVATAQDKLLSAILEA